MPKRLQFPKAELKLIANEAGWIRPLQLSVIGGCCHVLGFIDYFFKWFEVRPMKDKSATTVTQFLYVVICLRDFFEIQING